MRYVVRALGLALFLAIVATPGSAAASVRFGATLSNNADTTLACFNAEPDCSTVQTIRPETQQAGSPISGVVTMWRTRPAVNGDITFQIVRRNGSGASRVVASDTQSVQQDTVNEFFVRIPIQEGDLLGLNAAGSSEPMRASAGAQVARFVPPLGSDLVAPTELVANTELLVNATVEPDADGDGFGDDSQDNCPTNAATQGGCSGTLVGPLLNDDLEWGVDLRLTQNVTFASAAASPDGLMIPSDGVIVRWRIRPRAGPGRPRCSARMRGANTGASPPATGWKPRPRTTGPAFRRTSGRFRLGSPSRPATSLLSRPMRSRRPSPREAAEAAGLS